MSVIAHIRIPSSSFELGRIMTMESGTTVELDSMVPLGEKAIPLFSVYDHDADAFEESVRDHPSVTNLRVMSRHENQIVYALEWAVGRDVLFDGIISLGGHLLNAKGTTETWELELRFPTHEALSEFQEYCSNAHISIEVGRIYNPTKPGSGPWFGLTTTQRNTLMRAVQGGYYAIPRRISTQDLADEFDVSDQAVTERLRRAIDTLVEHTLIAQADDEEFETDE